MEVWSLIIALLACVCLGIFIGWEIGKRRLIEDGVMHAVRDNDGGKPWLFMELYQEPEKLYLDRAIVLKWADDVETENIRHGRTWMADD